MNTGKLTEPFRRLGLILLTDRIKFWYQQWKFRARNRAFRKENPGVILPPAYMLFEAFQLNYPAYWEGGQRSARGLMEILSRHQDLRGKRILDWGCGPARIVRHLPGILPESEIHGTDYNPKTVAWCRAHISGVQFAQNELAPPTGYPDDHFDAIYGISIFTHLSEARHEEWYEELIRICRPGGVLLLTTHGDIYRRLLTEAERKDYDAGRLVVRGQVKEGHRVYAAFHPPAYIRSLFGRRAEVLEYIEGVEKSWGLEQDYWVVRRR
jgi:SAM-dependent methyltransferase